MKIPIFISCPSKLNKTQEKIKNVIFKELDSLQFFQARTMGQTDYPVELPLKEVYSLAKHCSGGIILGFSQFETNKGIWKKGTSQEKVERSIIAFPSPWNQLEAGILFALGLPLLVFREERVIGGIFDNGVTDVFIQSMPVSPLNRKNKEILNQIFIKWSPKVRNHYYQ